MKRSKPDKDPASLSISGRPPIGVWTAPKFRTTKRGPKPKPKPVEAIQPSTVPQLAETQLERYGFHLPEVIHGSSALRPPAPLIPGLDPYAICPFYHLVPKDPVENIEWRKFCINRGLKDKEFAKILRAACRQDILFWINTFVFTLDPRRNDCKKIPLITWPEQDQAILFIKSCVGEHDLWLEKSRDQSATWDILAVLDHDFLHGEDVHYTLASIKGELVDDKSVPNTLFSKIDLIHDMLPTFLKPKLERTRFLWENKTGGCTINGEANNGNLGRSGRQKAMFLDEAPATANVDDIDSSTASVTDCRLWCGTHQGTYTHFYRNIQKPGKVVLRIHWCQRPAHRRGLYTFDASGKPQILDPSFRGIVKIERERYVFPNQYPFGYILQRLKTAGMEWQGRMLSPWYDNMCHRLGYNKVKIAQELDVDPSGSASLWFEEQLTKRIEEQFVRPPMHCGELDFDDRTGDPIGWIAKENGRLRLWQPLDERGRLREDHRFGIACDIAAGTGASASAAVIFDLDTGDFCGLWVDARISPTLFAYQTCAMRRWLSHRKSAAEIIWEANGGPGGTYGQKMMELEPGGVYRRLARSGVERTNTIKEPGFWSDDVTKAQMFNALLEALRNNQFIIPAADVVREMKEYINGPGAIPFHPGSINDDPTAAKDAHGDRVIATALAWVLLRDKNFKPRQMEKPPPPPGSLAAHMKEAIAQQEHDDAGFLPCEWEDQTMYSLRYAT